MTSSVQPRPVDSRAGTVGTARVGRRARDLVPRLRPGDVAVVDHLDMDRVSARALVDAGAAAVVDAAAIISGRYPNLGPRALAAAGLHIVDQVGPSGMAAIRDGVQVRLDGGRVLVDGSEVAAGRPLDLPAIEEAMELARGGLARQLAALTHSSTELLRHEEDLLLHGLGVPRLTTRVRGRPMLVVARDYEHDAGLRGVRAFVREQHPVVVAVGAAADTLRAERVGCDVVVVDAADDLPSAATLRAAGDVVVRTSGGGAAAVVEQLERLGVRPSLIETSAATEDAALVVADAADPTVIVGVGLRSTLEELLDGARPGVAGTVLTRLKVGPRLVDAAAVPQLYSGRVRPWHLLLVMLAGLVALAAAVSVTPVGRAWADSLSDTIQGLFS
ncbi:putative cytokinetic ring protein SteA [Nocardioides sp. YIM 152315]|uniref:putative cytokinetic ring protein SteA n=1 Tax=Nocardioides sp. YIM 152315 TaxID=3031760 RepID=UPI0023D9AC0F|nr:putative cytokinetic ring protein SteA [Nocardioides sp. YIM 152315]MDF1606527.1 putative cytokinetic ring protein SteA [Nocardioides sp. YIM 152315]